jgi:hypothetical protein
VKKLLLAAVKVAALHLLRLATRLRQLLRLVVRELLRFPSCLAAAMMLLLLVASRLLMLALLVLLRLRVLLWRII